MRNRTVITNVEPNPERGKYYVKRIPGEQVLVTADIFADGEDAIKACLMYKEPGSKSWKEAPMYPTGNDAWAGVFTVQKEGFYHYKIEAWTDHLATWRVEFRKKYSSGRHLGNELMRGSALLKEAAAKTDIATAGLLMEWSEAIGKKGNYQDAVNLALSEDFGQTVGNCSLKLFPTIFDDGLRVRVGRPKELFSTWYQMFPRSASEKPGSHGTFKDCERLIPEIAEMGFDVVLFTPIYPIGKTNRKGKDNSSTADPDDVGSPWSIGSEEGGQKSVNPLLGKMEDFENLLKYASGQGIEIALEIGLRCSPDHPYVKEHPEWFHRLPDGSLVLEEAPPMSYRDIIGFNFECDDWKNLWEELKNVVLFWAEKGVRIFCSSMPHLKPFAFWHWLISGVQEKYPDVIFLSGAFARQRVTNELAKVGFTQCFTDFIWKRTKPELQGFMEDLLRSETREYLRPNFFTNTPDVLPQYLRGAGENAFLIRYALAATMSSNCGIYGPAFELMYNESSPTGNEEYLHSEKYEIRHHDWKSRNRLTGFISQLNRLRREHPALQYTYNLSFTQTDNDQLISYVKISPDRKSIIWCIVNLDPNNTQTGYVEVPKEALGIKGRWINLQLDELLSGEIYHWFNDWNFVELKPERFPLHLLKLEL